jgi:hypothetical protein
MPHKERVAMREMGGKRIFLIDWGLTGDLMDLEPQLLDASEREGISWW